jgi:hypothetical protein
MAWLASLSYSAATASLDGLAPTGPGCSRAVLKALPVTAPTKSVTAAATNNRARL